MKLKSDSAVVGEYKYDALGRRVEKVVTGATYRYVYSGVETVSVYTSTGTWKQDYVYGEDIDEVVMLEQADLLDQDSDSNTSELTRSFYHLNALGSVMEVTDMSQAVAVSYRYDPYGQVTITRNSTTLTSDPLGQHVTYTGRWRDEETGLMYLRARHYQPTSGAFLQRDPQAYESGGSLYEYCMSSPAVQLDPMGERGGEPDPNGWRKRQRDLVPTTMFPDARSAFVKNLGALRAAAERKKSLDAALNAAKAALAAALRQLGDLLQPFWQLIRTLQVQFQAGPCESWFSIPIWLVSAIRTVPPNALKAIAEQLSAVEKAQGAVKSAEAALAANNGVAQKAYHDLTSQANVELGVFELNGVLYAAYLSGFSERDRTSDPIGFIMGELTGGDLAYLGMIEGANIAWDSDSQGHGIGTYVHEMFVGSGIDSPGWESGTASFRYSGTNGFYAHRAPGPGPANHVNAAFAGAPSNPFARPTSDAFVHPFYPK